MAPSLKSLSACLTLLYLFPTLVSATTYHVEKEYSGENFFDDWIFYGNRDNLTNGNAFYVDAADAAKKRLAFVNDAGNAIMRVDNSTQLRFGDNRDSIHISSKDEYTVGSVWIVDMLHVPYGCSTWPAFWSTASNWPTGGEIDTFEGVNMVTRNQMALHTTAGCSQVNPVQSSNMTNSTNCDYQANFNEGCVVTDPNTSSYGEAFAQAGGGIFVTEFAEAGISVWHFNRSSIPDSLQGNVTSFDTSSLGTPVANWPATGCSIDRFFGAQQLVFDITLCGDLAGMTTKFMQTCKGDCYHDFVIGDPSNYDNAYYEVKFVRVYNNGRNTRLLGNGAGQQFALKGSKWMWALTLLATASGAYVTRYLTGV